MYGQSPTHCANTHTRRHVHTGKIILDCSLLLLLFCFVSVMGACWLVSWLVRCCVHFIVCSVDAIYCADSFSLTALSWARELSTFSGDRIIATKTTAVVYFGLHCVHCIWTKLYCCCWVFPICCWWVVVFDVHTKWPQNHGEVVRLLLWYVAIRTTPKSNQHWHAFYCNSTVAMNNANKCIQYHPDNELTYRTGEDMSLFVWFLFCCPKNKEINRFLPCLACALLLDCCSPFKCNHEHTHTDNISLEQTEEQEIEHWNNNCFVWAGIV